jgi:hypothetical protein
MMPVVVISTVSSDGVKNFCSIAWITKVNSNPPLVVFALGPHKKTYKNIMEAKVFGINIPNRKLIDTIDYCGLNSGNTTVKDHVYTTFEGSITHAPLVEECAVNVNCGRLWRHRRTISLSEKCDKYMPTTVYLSMEKLTLLHLIQYCTLWLVTISILLLARRPVMPIRRGRCPSVSLQVICPVWGFFLP